MQTRISNGVEWYQDWDMEGHIVMVNAKTIKRYVELKDAHPDTNKYGVFFAFGTEQFKQGMASLKLRGYIKDDEKVCGAGVGLYGTRAELDRYLKFYGEQEKMIAKECDPQEVYFYEWNNHECMFADDDQVVRIIADYFGKEAAHRIERVGGGTATNVLVPLTERDEHLQQYDHELMMLSRLKFDCDGFFSSGDCRHHRPDCLWGGSIGRQIEEMRSLYNKLPDDIKDASCMSKEEIEEYARRMNEWADEEFAKPEYNPVRATDCDEYVDLEINLDGNLYYRDDDGTFQKPTHVWFSNDTRRCKQDEKCVHGRAFTSYLGKHGTTLAPVLVSCYDQIGFKPYRRADLCDVTADYEYRPLHSRLYNFHHE